MSTEPATTTVSVRPRYDGANIRTWIGFKQFLYLVEEAVLHWFRQRGIGPHSLYHEHGLGLEIVDTSAILPSLLEIDDEVTAEVVGKSQGRFTVRLHVEREGRRTAVLRGRVRVALIEENQALERRPLPDELSTLAAPSVEAFPHTGERRDLAVASGEDESAALLDEEGRGFYWPWRARYFHCHFSDRVQHSAYTRALEEVVDRFLVDRGLGVGHLLRERALIPVVSRVRVRLLADARMDETIHTVFTVEEIVKRQAFSARMDCWVRRRDTMLHTATAQILHGYAFSRGDQAGRLADLDDSIVSALIGGTRS